MEDERRRRKRRRREESFWMLYAFWNLETDEAGLSGRGSGGFPVA